MATVSPSSNEQTPVSAICEKDICNMTIQNSDFLPKLKSPMTDQNSISGGGELGKDVLIMNFI